MSHAARSLIAIVSLAIVGSCSIPDGPRNPSPRPPGPSLATSPTGARASLEPPFTVELLPRGALHDFQPTSVAFSDRSAGLVGGRNPKAAVLLRTVDGGASWTGVTAAAEDVAAIGSSGSKTWVALTCFEQRINCAAGIYVVGDQPAAWTRVVAGGITDLSFVSAEVGWAAFADLSSLKRTDDGGVTWQDLPWPCSEPWPMLAGVVFVDKDHGWVACGGEPAAGMASKAVLETTDGGSVWNVKAGIDVGSGRRVGQISASDYVKGLSMLADGSGIAWSGRGTTLRTIDGGTTWKESGPGEFDSVLPGAIAEVSRDVAFAAVWDGRISQSLLLRSGDQSRTWQKVSELVP